MTDREKLIDILEQAGTMRQFPGSLARILMENGVTFRPAVPGHTDQYNIAEMAYKNGYEDGKPKWISVKERLPEPEKCVLIYSKHGRVAEGKRNRFGMWTQFRWSVTELRGVTHWMPLPEEPKEVE